MRLDMAPRPAATLRAVTVRYPGVTALAQVDLVVGAGAVTALAGPNGAGKSTLLEVLAGIRSPEAGSRSVAGPIGYVPQRSAISPGLPVTVRDVVTLGARARRDIPGRRRGPAIRVVVDGALERTGIAALSAQPFGALSGGQCQRALLAQGLAVGAALLLLDEPTTALDAKSAARIRDLIRAEAERGAAVVCVSHDPLVLAGADRVVELEAGRIVAE